MSPTSSSRLFVGRNARSATLRTTLSALLLVPPAPPAGATGAAYGNPDPNASADDRQTQGIRPALCYVGAAVEGGFANLRPLVVVAAATLLLGGCGDDGDSGDDAKYTVEIVRAEFPTLQRLAEQSTLQIAVRNIGDDAIPNLAVTLHGLGERAADNPRGSLWVIDVPPRGAVTASTDTWTAGRVEPGATATLRWVVTPIQPGNRVLSYDVDGGLKGDVGATLADGGQPRGSISVRVTDKAPKARVDPRTGEVIRD